MSRVDSVSSIKAGKRTRIRNDVPEEGTKVRELHDYFLRYRGIPVPFVCSRSFRNFLPRLQDDYGFDLRCIKRGIWVLAGEWKGSIYIDYIAQIVNTEE
jgi:hypothetical protein